MKKHTFMFHRSASMAISSVMTFALILLGTATRADEVPSELVKIVDVTQKLNEVVVEEGLPWSAKGLAGARYIIKKQTAEIENALSRLRKMGATKVEVVNRLDDFNEPTWTNKSKYGSNLSSWQAFGLTSLGNKKGQSSVFPKNQTTLANYLTRIEPGACSLVEFSLFQPRTWFLPKKCQISVPTPDQFLRAALATNLQKITWDAGYWELNALQFALTEKTRLTVKDGYLFCPELSKFSEGINRVPLNFDHPLGGYSISLNLKTRHAVFTFKNLDQRALAKDAYKMEDEDFIGFFVSD